MKAINLPRIEFPETVAELIRLGVLADYSWGNDLAAAVLFADWEKRKGTDDPDTARRLWIAEEKPEEREDPEAPRFVVEERDRHGNQDLYVETDDLGKALRAFFSPACEPSPLICLARAIVDGDPEDDLESVLDPDVHRDLVDRFRFALLPIR